MIFSFHLRSQSLTAIVNFSGISFRFFDNGGLLTSASSLFGILIGFFITALAAVATFSNKTVDKRLNGHGAFVKGVELTRRQFLCFLFGYLTFLSFSLFFVSMACAAVHGKGWGQHLGQYEACIRLGSLFLFSFALAHLFCICLLGMHYLIYRLHVPSVGTVTVSSDTESK